MNYLAYHFRVHPAQPGSDILIALIADYGFDSFDSLPDGFTAYIKEEDAVAFQPDEFHFDDFEFSYTVEKIGNVNWNAEWEKNFEPVQVGRLLNIRASFHPPDPFFEQEIVITPKMSFGTGHHQTTRLVCAELFATDVSGKRVLDMGCGTGILAILAKRLGAADVLGIDIDAWSVENSIENCAVNNCPDIVVKLGDVALLKNEQPFDLILANINKNILRADLPVYSQKLLPGGKLFLSGFFVTDVPELRQVAEANGLVYRLQHNENEWAMVVFSNPHSSR